MPTTNDSVKICGLTELAAAHAAIEAGADLLGLVHFAASPRHLSLEAAKALTRRIRARAPHIAIALVTVDADDALLERITSTVAPDWLQLHGTESPDRLRAIRTRAPHLKLLKALAIREHADLAAASAYMDAADALLFDATPPKDAALPGGNGETFDWSLLIGYDAPLPWFLSGGLTPQNVRQAMQVSGAACVDVSSGVESAPGIKDTDRIRQFITEAKRKQAT